MGATRAQIAARRVRKVRELHVLRSQSLEKKTFQPVVKDVVVADLFWSHDFEGFDSLDQLSPKGDMANED